MVLCGITSVTNSSLKLQILTRTFEELDASKNQKVANDDFDALATGILYEVIFFGVRIFVPCLESSKSISFLLDGGLHFRAFGYLLSRERLSHSDVCSFAVGVSHVSNSADIWSTFKELFVLQGLCATPAGVDLKDFAPH